jgi:UDP-N-acetylmuramate dehydrogenase
MLEMRENVDIKEYCTLKVGGQFRYFVELSDKSQLPEVYKFAKEKKLPVFVLGGGSNMVFPDGVLEKVVVKINFSGFEILNDTSDYTDIKIGAGEKKMMR